MAKYRIPIEMTKEAAKDFGVAPKDLHHAHINGKITTVYYWETDDENVYNSWMREFWRIDKALEREKRCWVSNGKGKLVRCKGKCSECDKFKESAVSLELMEETGGFLNQLDGIWIVYNK